jgi:hypothetical protein
MLRPLIHVQDTLPGTAKGAGGEFVKGVTKQVVKTAVDPTGAVVDTVIHDKPTADVVKAVTNPVGFIASKIF